MLRTIVYVDGFNFYYGSLKGTAFRWLDPQALFGKVLSRARNDILAVKYFTARVQPVPSNPGVEVRQHAYLQAVRACAPKVEVIFGHFLRHVVRMPSATPPPNTCLVYKSEEKGSDVNLALHLLNDAWRDAYDCAVVVSNDSDLAEAMCMVKKHHPAKVLGLVTPGAPVRRTSPPLARYADFQRPIRAAALRASQLPSRIDAGAGVFIERPGAW